MTRFMVRPLVLLLCALLVGCNTPPNPPTSRFFSKINLQVIPSPDAFRNSPELGFLEGVPGTSSEGGVSGCYNYSHQRKDRHFQYYATGPEKAVALAQYVANEIDTILSNSDVEFHTIGTNEPRNVVGSHEVEKRYSKVEDGWCIDGTIQIFTITGEKTDKGQLVILIVLIDESTALTGAKS